MRVAPRVLFTLLSIPSGAHAIDGVFEINQVCAAGPGCFPGDSAGFPVQIGSGGSYTLTSNLTAPNQFTTLISITVAGVSLDLNGFGIRGTNGFDGPGGACSAPGGGPGVSASVSASDVRVSNGRVTGMGFSGVSLLGANSSIDRMIIEQNCGNGIQIGFGSLVANSVVRRNSANGIVADQSSRVSHSIADLNGSSGITSPANSGLLTVHGCVATGNGIDGIFVGSSSRVSGSYTAFNLDDGIAALANGQVVENVAYANTDRGITVLGGSADSTAIGLNVTNANGGLNLSGGVAIDCNVIGGGAPVCPP